MEHPTTKISIKEILVYHLPVILYGAAILVVSSISNLRTPEIRLLAVDKLAHFAEYAIFAFLLSRSAGRLDKRPSGTRGLVLSFAFLVGFALMDEYLQKFTPGRQFDLLDYVADLAGGGCILLLLWRKRRSREGN